MNIRIKTISKKMVGIIFLPRNLSLQLLVLLSTTQVGYCAGGDDPFAPTTSLMQKIFGPDSSLMTDANYLIGVGGICAALFSPLNFKQAAGATMGVYALKYIISYGMIGTGN